MRARARRKHYLFFMILLLGILSILIYYSIVLGRLHDADAAGASPIFDEFYYYGDSVKDRPVPMQWGNGVGGGARR